MLKAVLVFFALLAVVVAIRVPRVEQAHACNKEGSCLFHDYQRHVRAHPEKAHKVTIWSRQNDFAAQCDTLLMDVSDPKSANYGQHLSFDQLRSLTYDDKAIKAIHTFLDKHHVAKDSRETAPNGEWVEFTAPVKTIERMFNTELHEFRSASRSKMIVRAFDYTVPAELAEEVTIVAGISNFPVYRKKTEIVAHTAKRMVAQNSSGMYPSLIWKTYRIPNETTASSKADMGVFEALGQSYSDADLKVFQNTYGLPRQKINKIIGPNDPSSCAEDPNNCVEATLDVEYIMAMAWGAPMTYWSIADENGDIFLEWIKAVSKSNTVPQVFSISYGGPEHLQNKGDMKQFSIEACKMGLRGMTIFVSSGDDGVAGYEARQDPSQCGFKPDYPAGVPYVTSVGATMGPELRPPRAEVVCQSNAGSIITSGGGFSTVFAQPSWQSTAVNTYLQTGPKMPPSSMFNSKGRAYPDVSSLGNAYNIVVGGQWFQVSGTSASSPVFCGIVALINGDREADGKNPLGFINPVLYSVDKSAYNDVTQGVNNCCAGGGSGPVCCKYGFTASKGWDPATGWGSIDYPVFAKALENLP